MAYDVKTVTDAQIGKFRFNLPDSEWRLKHDCLVANGMRRSPHKGGKLEARARVVAAMNAQVVTVAKLGKVAAEIALGERMARRRTDEATKRFRVPGNADSIGTTCCVCGHAVEEHGNHPEYPGSTACQECPPDGCIAYEADR